MPSCRHLCGRFRCDCGTHPPPVQSTANPHLPGSTNKKPLLCDRTHNHSQGPLRQLYSFHISWFTLTGVCITKGLLDGKQLVISCAVVFNNFSIRTLTLVDRGRTIFTSSNKDCARLHFVSRLALNAPRIREVTNGLSIDFGPVTDTLTHTTRLWLNIRSFKAQASFLSSA